MKCLFYNIINRGDVSMKLLKNIFKHTLLYKLFSTLYWLKTYINDYNYVSDSLYSDAFFTILRRYLNTEFRSDWIGRIYGVINPHINIDKSFNFSNTIIEIDGDNTNSKAYVENWIYRQMSLVKSVFNLDSSGFFDFIYVNVKHVGPSNHDNFLVVFDIASRKEFATYFKKTCRHAILYIIVITIWLLGLKYIPEIPILFNIY